MAEPEELGPSEIDSLIRGLPPEELKKALDRTLASLSGPSREALEGLMAVVAVEDLDATKLAVLPQEALAGLASVLFEHAADVAYEDPSKPHGDRTAPLDRELWKPDPSRNDFRSFYEANGKLSRQEFVEKNKTPYLVSDVSFDRATWTRAIVIPVVKKGDPAPGVSVGRDPDCDIVIGHASVSKRHVVIAQEDGKWLVTDAGSANGTKVDDTTVQPGKSTRLRDVSKLDLAGARLTFNTPVGLFHFLEQIRKLEGHNTRRVPAAKVAAAIASQAASERRPVAPPPPARATPHKESAAKAVLGGVASLIGTPRRIAATVLMVALLLFSIVRIGPPLAFLLFGESHPEWFEKDLPDYIKNRKPIPAAPPRAKDAPPDPDESGK